MAKGQRKVSNERFLAAIPGTGGLHTVIAQKLGINRVTVSEYIKRDPALAAAGCAGQARGFSEKIRPTVEYSGCTLDSPSCQKWNCPAWEYGAHSACKLGCPHGFF